ncbi:MAG: AAA family ATPase, partial [Acidimicrobiia bacterium]
MLGMLGSSFVGRADELEDVRRALQTRRLVTLVGEGGVGKTRLAAEAARSMEPESDRLVWVDLGRVADGHGVRAAFEDALRADGGPGGFDELLDRLGPEPALVVVDNCEHVTPQAAEHVALVADRCRGARVLATSRTRLGIPGERVVSLRPLGLPDRDVLS